MGIEQTILKKGINTQFQRSNPCLSQYLKNSAHLLIVKACLASLLFNCTHHSVLRFFANRISCMNSPTCCSTIFFVISTASPFVLTRKANKNGFFMSTALCKPPFSLYYVYKEWATSNDDFSVKEATFNLILAECMQKTCGNLNPRLPKNRSNALICDFYWRLSHILSVQENVTQQR